MIPTDARVLLQSLVGKPLQTMTGKPNTILSLSGDFVIVSTNKSPKGQPVRISWVQGALDGLMKDGEIEISVKSVGYRSAFIGAVLSTLPGTSQEINPRRITLNR